MQRQVGPQRFIRGNLRIGEWLRRFFHRFLFGACRITDCFQRRFSEALFQLCQIQTVRRDGRILRIDNSLGQQRTAVEGAGFLFLRADAADRPVGRAGRVLNDVVFGIAIPGHAPAHRPAVAGAHHAAVHQIDAAVGHRAIVDQQTGRPPHVRLHPAALAAEGAIENYIRPRLQTGGPHKVHVAAGDFAAIQQNLAPLDAEIGRLRRAEIGVGVRHDNLLHRDALAREHGAVHRLFAVNIAHKAIVAANADGRIRGLAIGDFQRRALDVQLLDADVIERRFRADFGDRGAGRIQILGVVRIR